MAKAKRYDCDIGRLCATMKRARLALRRFREMRREAVRQYVGSRWSEEGADREVIVNLVNLYITTVSRSLIAKDPRFLYTTSSRENKPAVKAAQSWVNRRVKQMGLKTHLTRVVVDALISMGIMKVSLASPAAAAAVGWNLQAGQPFAQRVDLDDFVFDVHARDFEEASFIGHRYRVPLWAVKDSPIYNRMARQKLTPSQDEPYNAEGDERINVLQRSYYDISAEEFEDQVDLWEIYLPRQKRVITLADNWIAGAEADDEPLLDQEWLGPDRGPYHFLCLGTVPGNAMPSAPVQNLMPLHELANSLYRKLGEQARRQKEVTFVSGGADNDGQRLINTNDGEATRIDNPDKLKQVIMGGPNQANFLFFEKTWQYFSKHGGNIEMLAGLAAQSKTATQDKMLDANSSGIMTSMAEDTTGFVESVGQALGWYWWHHPTQEMRTKFSLPGLPDYAIDRKVTPQQRQKQRWDELDVEVDPYSMQPQTPQSRIAAINSVVQAVQPFMQLAQQQGITFDLNAYVKMMSDYMNLPELTEVLTITEPPTNEAAPGGGSPAETTRNYNRRSMGADSQGSQENDLSNQMQSAQGMDNKMPMNPSMNGAA